MQVPLCNVRGLNVYVIKFSAVNAVLLNNLDSQIAPHTPNQDDLHLYIIYSSLGCFFFYFFYVTFFNVPIFFPALFSLYCYLSAKLFGLPKL